MFVADEIKTRFDVYFAEDIAIALTEALAQPAPLHWLADRWHLDEVPSNNGRRPADERAVDLAVPNVDASAER